MSKCKTQILKISLDSWGLGMRLKAERATHPSEATCDKGGVSFQMRSFQDHPLFATAGVGSHKLLIWAQTKLFLSYSATPAPGDN